LEDAQDAPQVVKCWMCRSTIDAVPSDPGPDTLAVPSSGPRDAPSPIGISADFLPEAAKQGLPAGTRVEICVVVGPSLGKEFEITKSITTIGRTGGGADFEIDDPEVSRSHCAVEVRREGILLHDLRSTNGTYLRGSRVSVVRLEPMSIFRIGTSHLQVTTT
jgi:pSer/pThr/pTyr-binding forkhead associated (FHA) protein